MQSLIKVLKKIYKLFTVETITLNIARNALEKEKRKKRKKSIPPEEIEQAEKWIKEIEIYIQKGYPKSKIFRPLDRFVLTPFRVLFGIIFALLILSGIYLILSSIFPIFAVGDTFLEFTGALLIIFVLMVVVLVFIQSIENLIFVFLARRWVKKNLKGAKN